MKYYTFLFLSILLLVSCSSNFTNKRYVYINESKEHDIEIMFFKDSTFILKDVYGCNKMGQKGNWSFLNKRNNNKLNTSIILKDTTKVSVSTNMHNKIIYSYTSSLDNKKYMYTENSYFLLINIDTAYFTDKNILKINNFEFVHFNGNIEKKRIKILEKQLTNKVGKKIYIETLGKGISSKKARENLKICK
ncbi:hypothetical protein SAMN05443634_102298 [Chishuiella changwenlii]|uniref:Lipoprotein n=1 Tax=Chishuiella changwenlii TaxID=1434701 RepID=A0A1M6UBI4_9FLAO|nr:hypothetical protein [Chishuiella changwenlii]GGE99265.1 hypothetical protein GCM10010984_16060 [Chishuiella changwenlii]SHK66574.1 hypothetical protein SAMN05443634_102298 [Chishuiella changwenlii]